MTSYIKGRKHLQPIIKRLDTHNVITRKFAKILKDESESETIGFIQRDTARTIGVKSKSKIIIKREYLLHMDNSGHFTGYGYGKNGHSDKKPLSVFDISIIPKIIKAAKENDIEKCKKRRNMERTMIIKNDLVVIVEYKDKGDEVFLVTAYNKQNSR